MSKKLIAVASAAALALSALVATPAAANTFAVTVSGDQNDPVKDGTSISNAYLVWAPTEAVFRTTGLDTVLAVDVDATTATGNVTVTATGGIKLLTEDQFDDTDNTDLKTGTSTLSINAEAFDADFYLYSTSTTAGSVTVENAGNKKVFYVKANSTSGYTINFTAPATASKGIDYKLTGTVVDMFGNPTVGLTTADFTISGLGAFSSATDDVVKESSTKGTYTITVTDGAAAAGPGSLVLTLDGDVYDEDTTLFTGFVDSQFFIVNSQDPAVQITALTAQVAALNATIAGLVADYNKLAKRANKKFNKKKVALK